MNAIERVFFHELGHFIAHEINQKSSVEKMGINPCETDYIEMCGYCTPKNPLNSNEPVPIERLCKHLAVVVHGCLFQSYFTGEEFDNCMSSNGNGSGDTIKWSAILSHYAKPNDKIASIERKYSTKINLNRVLEDFRCLEVNNYIIPLSRANNFEINLEKLRIDTEQMIENYAPIYRILIEEYQYIIFPK